MNKILVVDDDKLIRWSLKEIFIQEGYEVDIVATAKDALSHVTNNTYNLIFADIDINEENGINMLRKIRKIQPSTKIVTLSTYPKHQIEPTLDPLNIFSIVEKPFQAEQIKAIAKKAIDLQKLKEGGGNQKRRVSK